MKRLETVERNKVVRKAEQFLWTDEGEIAREYLFKTRGLKEETVRAFRLGYLPEDLNHLLRGRIILPLFDPSGNLVTVTTRLPREPKETDPLPPHWHESYTKTHYLYGIHLAKEYMRKWKFVLVVEGQFDALQLYNSGLKSVVALGSVNLHDVQLATIFRYCDEIIVMLDVDKNQSGQKGTKKILEANNSRSISTGFQPNLVEGQRHTSLVYSGTSQYKMLLDHKKIAAITLDRVLDPDEYIRTVGYAPIRKMVKAKLREMRDGV